MYPILAVAQLLSCLLEMGVEYYLVCIREALLCGKGVEPPRGRGRLSGVRETQLFLRICQKMRRDKHMRCTDVIDDTCGEIGSK